MMCKAELEALAEKYAAKAEKAYQNYQETGISRYSREYHNAEELFYAFQAAANARRGARSPYWDADGNA